jgi:cysteine-rich repeat protein
MTWKGLGRGLVPLALSGLLAVHAACALDTAGTLDRPDGGEIPDGLDGEGEAEAEILPTCGDGDLDDGEECDDGNDTGGDGCEPGTCRYSCHDEPECDDGLGCTEDTCDVTSHTCLHGLLPEGSVCRPSRGACDLEEVCDGAARQCPGDLRLAAGTVCRPSIGECDLEETCPVDSPACPEDIVVAAGTPCAADGDDCTEDACDGEGACGRALTGLHGVLQVSAGAYHTCALVEGGAVKCWGLNLYGGLGNASYVSTSSPVDVAGLGSGVRAIASGGYHTCALLEGGSVKCWGVNWYGELGDGTQNSSNVPVDVVGLGSGVRAVAAGMFHTCAVTTGGGVVCWGANGEGQLGDYSSTDRSSPVNVYGLGLGFADVDCGDYHSCARTEAGWLKCWGGNWGGQLGNNTYSESSIPVDVAGMSSGVRSFSLGGEHSCALLDSGALRCWGANWTGQIGDGSVIYRPMPVDVMGSGVSAVTAGGEHTCALLDGGETYCWGGNWSGQVGDGTLAVRTVPAAIGSLAPAVSAVSAGTMHTCAVVEGGTLRCWGSDEWGQLGVGMDIHRMAPVGVAGLGGTVTFLSVGSTHACAVLGTGALRCWGHNWNGQLGDGSVTDRSSPVDVTGLASGVSAVSCGAAHTCALMDGGGVKCWGGNWVSQLGDGTTEERYAPVDVSGLTSGVIAVAAGSYHTCALIGTGGVRCWGENEDGQLGIGSTMDHSTPQSIIGLSSVTQLAAGGHHTCAVSTGGAMRCWGRNDFGQQGDGTTGPNYTPYPVTGLSSGTATADCGNMHTCAVTTGGALECWGGNYSNQVGDGTSENRLVPANVSGLSSGVAVVAAGDDHTCAVLSTGGVACWGANFASQLGFGTFDGSTFPETVSGLASGVVGAGAGSLSTCALLAGGAVQCWGARGRGQIGDGGDIWRTTPQDVLCD